MEHRNRDKERDDSGLKRTSLMEVRKMPHDPRILRGRISQDTEQGVKRRDLRMGGCTD